MTDFELAQNPNTSPKLLEKLACSKDKSVRMAVAKNPNVPEVLLPRLIALYPEAALENPLLEWLRFLNPAWFEELPDFARFALLGSKLCPSGWLETAERLGVESQLAALRNPLFKTKILDEWFGQADARVNDALLGHVANTNNADLLPLQDVERNNELFKDALVAGLPMDTAIFAVLAADFDSELRALVAQRLDVPSSILESLALDEEESVACIAQQRGISVFVQEAQNLALRKPKDLNKLALGKAKARRLAAQHSTISKKLLKQLSSDDDWQVRQLVAGHIKTPVPVLARLAVDYDRDVREAVANNPSSSSSILELLLSDSYEAVHLAARANPNTPQATVRLLNRLEQKDPTLLELESLPLWMATLAAAHPNASANLLETFAKNEVSSVRAAVAANPRSSQRLLEVLALDADVDVVLALLNRANLPDAVLVQLAEHTDSRVLEGVSAHLGLSKSLLELLSKNSNWQVRRNVAAHPRCPTVILEFLAQDADVDVREAAVRNPNANALVALYALGVELRLPQALKQLEAQDLNLSASWLEFVARRGNDLAKRLVAGHINLGVDMMTWFLTQTDFKIRLALVNNPSLPTFFLEKLALDDDRDVRLAVAQHQSTSEILLRSLATDADSSVRVAVAERGVAHELLCWDEDEAVLNCLEAKHLTLRRKLETRTPLEPVELEALLNSQIPFVMQYLPNDVFLENLEQHLTHEAWQVRQNALRNLHCTTQHLEQLLFDSDRDVRAEIAKHPHVTPEMLTVLMQDTDILVRRTALSNPRLEPNLRSTAQRLILDESLRSSKLNRIFALSLSTRISELSKRKNASSLEWRERLAVANNPNTPPFILEQLSQDAHRTVRSTAQQKLEAKKAQPLTLNPFMEGVAAGGGSS
ncbi:MAG: hypothetical protein RLZZ156_575 [Deinococcota bacterium]